MDVEDMLSALVGFPSVVGTSNQDIADFIRDFLTENGVETQIIPGPEGDRVNLFATIGPADVPGYILSGHLDVVPAAEPEWQADPFTLRRKNGVFTGRGAVDMKGFVAAVLSVVPRLVDMPLSRPLHIALSYDEEAGCRGVVHLIKRLPSLCAKPLGCFVGEPSGMCPVLRHKGKAALTLRAKGVSGHSSRPDLGRNAVHTLLPFLNKAVELSDLLRRDGAQHAAFEPPYSTLQIGVMNGGQSLNIIPDQATAEIEVRAVPSNEPKALLAPLLAMSEASEDVVAEIVATYPALDLDGQSHLARLASGLTTNAPVEAVSYGTEAGLFQKAGVPAIVCGPGDIRRAHKPEEFITRHELPQARHFVLNLAQSLT